ncbi:RNA polymerase sigma factor [Capillimicrobium parvum]|nr:sigma-70 family RNA polymerase sigma factor [Capillimicrobium parvum]
MASSSVPQPVGLPGARNRPRPWRLRRGTMPVDVIETVYREHLHAVYGFFSYSVGRDTAEDLTAATFERIVRSWNRFDPARSSEQTWIFAIARNVLIDHLRRQRHRNGPSLDEHPEIVDSIVSAQDPLAQAVSVEGVKAWLSQLRPREREVVALRYCADLSVAEIAQCMDTTPANVHQICSRALRRLRETVDPATGQPQQQLARESA